MTYMFTESTGDLVLGASKTLPHIPAYKLNQLLETDTIGTKLEESSME